MLVEAQVSSMKISRSGSRSSWPSNQASRRLRMSGRSCSAACAVFFLRVIRWRRQKRQSAVTLTWAPCSAKRAFNSGRVISGTSAKAAWIRSACASVRRESRSPPCGLGRASPPARRRACQRIALDALTPNRAAAWRHDRPSSMAARTRERRSKDSALGMEAGLLASLCPESDQPLFVKPNRLNQSANRSKAAINRYYEERNLHFQQSPRRAGKKIWGKERECAVFEEGNNCKDPYYYR